MIMLLWLLLGFLTTIETLVVSHEVETISINWNKIPENGGASWLNNGLGGLGLTYTHQEFKNITNCCNGKDPKPYETPDFGGVSTTLDEVVIKAVNKNNFPSGFAWTMNENLNFGLAGAYRDRWNSHFDGFSGNYNAGWESWDPNGVGNFWMNATVYGVGGSLGLAGGSIIGSFASGSSTVTSTSYAFSQYSTVAAEGTNVLYYQLARVPAGNTISYLGKIYTGGQFLPLGYSGAAGVSAYIGTGVSEAYFYTAYSASAIPAINQTFITYGSSFLKYAAAAAGSGYLAWELYNPRNQNNKRIKGK